MMYEILYKFLIKYKRLDIPGVGAILVQVQPSESQFIDQSFLPPKYFTAFATGQESPSGTLFSWVAGCFNITETEAIAQFNDFVLGLKRQLEEGKRVVWNGVGVLQRDSRGEIDFTGIKEKLDWFEGVTAKKVMRENAEHKMLVGETEKTSTQMTEILLNPRPVFAKPNHWWVWPLALIVALFIFLGWYFSEHGFPATGSNHKSAPAEAPTGYKLSQ